MRCVLRCLQFGTILYTLNTNGFETPSKYEPSYGVNDGKTHIERRGAEKMMTNAQKMLAAFDPAFARLWRRGGAVAINRNAMISQVSQKRE